MVTLCYIVYRTNGAWSRLKVREAATACLSEPPPCFSAGLSNRDVRTLDSQDIFGFVRHAAADPQQRAAMMADGAALLRASQTAMQADGKKGLKRE